MSEISRRELVQIAMAAAASGGSVKGLSAQHVHQVAADEKAANSGVYKPKAFDDHEYLTIQKLAELIVPADDVSPSAIESGAGEFIDLLCSNNAELSSIYTGGIFWLDRQMQHRYGANFLNAKPEQQTAMLDLISYRKNAVDSPDLGPGIKFFNWARMMVVDAYYTSKAGIKDVGYMGNKGMAKFEIPQEAIDYALKRSPV
jgi:gluconate 2-dehydrogenase gamma chain